MIYVDRRCATGRDVIEFLAPSLGVDAGSMRLYVDTPDPVQRGRRIVPLAPGETLHSQGAMEHRLGGRRYAGVPLVHAVITQPRVTVFYDELGRGASGVVFAAQSAEGTPLAAKRPWNFGRSGLPTELERVMLLQADAFTCLGSTTTPPSLMTPVGFTMVGGTAFILYPRARRDDLCDALVRSQADEKDLPAAAREEAANARDGWMDVGDRSAVGVLHARRALTASVHTAVWLAAIGWSHSDYKPDNIVLMEEVQGWGQEETSHLRREARHFLIPHHARPMVTDLDRIRRNITSTEAVGTAAYMAPETRARVAHSPFVADLWSIGVTFTATLCGMVPPTTTDQQSIFTFIDDSVLPCVPSGAWREQVRGILRRLLRVNPAERFPHMAPRDELLRHALLTPTIDMGDALQELVDSSEVAEEAARAGAGARPTLPTPPPPF